MSKKNIVKRETVGNKIHLTFENDDGRRTYEYGGSSKRAIERGKDPAGLTGGRLIRHEKKD